MRLIDADALDEKLGVLMDRCQALCKKQAAQDYNFVRTVLDTAPTVDAVPVVRCKDCLYRHELKVTGGVLCDHEEGLMSAELKDTDFCPYGERRGK